MALIANNISGSASNSSRIGITGSVIFANSPDSSFPVFPGTDISFFVSGSPTQKSLFSGDLVVSGSLKGVGTNNQLDSLSLTGSTGLAVTGDIAVNGGDITTTAPTFNLLNGATTINLGSTASNRLINIGTGTAVQSINIGSENTTSSLILLAGTGNILLSGSTTATYTIGSSLGTGTITIGRSTDANIISIGSAGNNTANDQTVFIANGTGKSTVTIGSNAAHTGKTTIQGGTSSGGGVVIGQSLGRIGFFGLTTPVTVQTVTDITNNVASGGTSNTLSNYNNLTQYSSDASAIRGNFYQIGVKLNAIIDALQAYGLF